MTQHFVLRLTPAEARAIKPCVDDVSDLFFGHYEERPEARPRPRDDVEDNVIGAAPYLDETPRGAHRLIIPTADEALAANWLLGSLLSHAVRGKGADLRVKVYNRVASAFGR